MALAGSVDARFGSMLLKKSWRLSLKTDSVSIGVAAGDSAMMGHQTSNQAAVLIVQS